jgi:predicted dehydrogenase
MLKKYRIAVIGHTGRGNYGHGIDTVWLEIPDCEIVGVSDADAEGRAEAVKRLHGPPAFADYREMLDAVKPDIVAIGPRWLDQHCEMVVAAAERGCHIYMEKPFCRSLEEADTMVAACEKHQIKLAIAHQTRYSPKIQTLREIIDGGLLGDILELRGRGKEDARGGGEDLWVLGSHIMNLIHTLGGEPLACYATIQQNGHPATPKDVQPGNEGIGPLVGDAVSAMYQLENGVTAYFGSRRNTAGGRFGLQIFGSKGVIEIVTGHLPAAYFLPDPMWSPGRSGANWQPISSAGVGQPEPLKDGGLHGGNILACQDLMAAIEEDRQPECSAYEARMTIEMIAAVFESHRLGQPVAIPLANRRNPLEQWRA